MAQAPVELTEEQRRQLEEKLKNMSPEQLAQLQKEQCIFCQIIAGKIPSQNIFEDDNAVAILDINPAAKGHVLIIPKEHYPIMPLIPDAEMAHLFLVAKRVSHILLKTLKVGGTSIFVANGIAAGQKSQHFMLHLIPRREGDHLISYEEKVLPPDIQKKVAVVIENKLNTLLGIKKEIINADQEPEEITEPAAVAAPNLFTPAFLPPSSSSVPSPSSQSKNTPDAPKKKRIPRKKKKTESSSEQSETPAETPAKKPVEKDSGVSLDDIANLFK